MISFSVVKDILIEKAQRILKVQQYGAKTADQVSSFGDDSAPLKDMIAIYAGTSEVGDNIILGYINKNQIAKPGEKRIFSLKEDGSISFEIYLKKDGSCVIGPGAADNAVRYSKLEQAFNQLKGEFNALVALYNAHVHVTPAGVPSPATPPVPPAQSSTANIAPAKIDEVKVP